MPSPAVPMPVTLPAEPDQKFTEEPVLWIHHWNDGLMSLRVRRDPAYLFVPGQFARIGLRKADGAIIWRAYSIVSAPHEGFLEFFMVVVPTGEFSSRAAQLGIRSTMLVERQAQGFLTANRFKDGRDLWLLGTGTGLAPYISMLRDPAVWTQFAHIVLVVSVRERGDLGYVHEIESMAQESADNPAGRARLAFVTTVTREAGDAGCLNGRIPALIESGQLEKAAALGLSDADSRFMLCGNPQMVEAMRTLLKSRGYRMNRKLEPGHIIVENYW